MIDSGMSKLQTADKQRLALAVALALALALTLALMLALH